MQRSVYHESHTGYEGLLRWAEEDRRMSVFPLEDDYHFEISQPDKPRFAFSHGVRALYSSHAHASIFLAVGQFSTDFRRREGL